MSAELGKLAQYFEELAKKQGKPRLQRASVLAAMAAEIVREENGPEYMETSEPEIPIFPQVLMGTLIEILTAEGERESRESLLNDSLAMDLHEAVFSQLPDGIRLADLRMPVKKKEGYAKEKYKIKYPYDDELYVRALNIDRAAKAPYNRVVSSLLGAGLDTIGSFRNSDMHRLLEARNVGRTTIRFAAIAFNGPSAELPF